MSKKRRCPCCGRKGWKGTKAERDALRGILKYAVPIVEQADLQQDWRIEMTPQAAARRQALRQQREIGASLAEAEAREARLKKENERLEKNRAYQRRYYARGREKARLAREQRTNGGPNVH